MIYIDSNIPMYLVGSDHPNKVRAQKLVHRAVEDEVRLVSSVEVIQEILHRYVAIDRRDAIQPALDVLLGIVDNVLDVTLADGLRARDIVLGGNRLSARDALHIAVMERAGLSEVMSFDTDFDRWPSLHRLE